MTSSAVPDPFYLPGVEVRDRDVQGHRDPGIDQLLNAGFGRGITSGAADGIMDVLRSLHAYLYPVHTEVRKHSGPLVVHESAVREKVNFESLLFDFTEDFGEVVSQERLAAGNVHAGRKRDAVGFRPGINHVRHFTDNVSYFPKWHLVRAPLALVAMFAPEVAALGKMPLNKKFERLVGRHKRAT